MVLPVRRERLECRGEDRSSLLAAVLGRRDGKDPAEKVRDRRPGANEAERLAKRGTEGAEEGKPAQKHFS